MSRFMLVVAIALSLISIAWTTSGVAQEDMADVTKDQLVGTWDAKFEVDVDKVKKMLSDQGLEGDQFDLAIAAFKTQFSRLALTLTFNADGSSMSEMSGVGRGMKEKGTWEFLEGNGPRAKIKAKSERSPERTVDLVFDGPDRFSMESEELKQAPIKKVMFERKKPEEDAPEAE